MYKRLVGVISRHALGVIADEVERVTHIGFYSGSCGCVLRATYGVPCACELARYVYGVIPLTILHIMWTRLSFKNISSNQSLPWLCIDKEIDMMVNHFNEVDIAGKVTIKQKLLEIVCPAMTSMVAPMQKVKTKGVQHKKVHRSERSTKCDPSYFEHVDAFFSSQSGHSLKSDTKSKRKCEEIFGSTKESPILMLDQFHLICHPYIVNIVNVVVDGHYGYRCIATLLGMGEESWPLIQHDTFKELSQWHDEYERLVGSYDHLEELRKSLLVELRAWVCYICFLKLYFLLLTNMLLNQY